MRTEPGAAPVVGADEHPLELLSERLVAAAHGVVHRRDEEHERRDPLLAVDEHQLGRVVGACSWSRGWSR